MTAIAAFGSEKTHRRSLAMPVFVMAAGFAALTLAASWTLARAVLRGAFADPDDAMRLVEVRAWMAGQPWFDVDAARLDPPAGASMHWSRLVDLPNAALIRLLGTATTQPEAWDRIVLPSLLLVLLYAGMTRLALVALGRPAQLTALVGTFFSGVTLVQFQPGRIGHHALDTVLLVWAVALMLASTGRGRAWRAAVAGALTALSLATSLETLPLFAGLCAATAALWIVEGDGAASTLRGFTLGLGLVLPTLFAATVAPDGWLSPVCDRLGAAHVGAALIFAGGGMALAAGTPHLPTRRARALAAAAVAAVAALFVLLCYPACLGSPFAGVDPLVRAVWLDHVAEAETLVRFGRERPALGLALAVPVALGIAGEVWAAVRLPGAAGRRFAVLAGVSALGFLLGCWQVRAFAPTAPLALVGGVFAAARLRAALDTRGLHLAARFAPVAILPFTSTGWAVALPADPATIARGPGCLAAEAFPPLAALPSGRVVAPINAGSHLLEATPHSVFAAPYHRNNDGNRFSLDVWTAPPARAAALLAERHVAYVMTCPGLGETAALAARAPDGLAAVLARGTIPGFLRPLPLAGTPYRVYAVDPASR